MARPPPFAGKNIANPIGAISTAAMMLEHLGFAGRIRAHQSCRTRSRAAEEEPTADIGGSLGTRESAEWIASSLSRNELREPYRCDNYCFLPELTSAGCAMDV